MRFSKAAAALLLILCILVSGCGTPSPDSSTIPETSETSQTPKTVYEFPVVILENRALTISLQLASDEESSAKEIQEVQIYDGSQLLQTITTADIPEVTDYDWAGLFLNESSHVGLPDVRDLNFDGAEDFGLLAVCAYPQNVPYSYFIWNGEKEIFEYQFTAFGPGWLQIDDAQRCLIEVSTVGTVTFEKLFWIDPSGKVVADNQSDPQGK